MPSTAGDDGAGNEVEQQEHLDEDRGGPSSQ